MARSKKSSPAKKKKPAKKKAAAPEAAPGPLLRWPGALLGALVGAALGAWLAEGLPTEPDALAALFTSPQLAAAGLAFGSMAAWALGSGPLGGVLGGALGLGLAGLAVPLALTPDNWRLALLGLVLGGAARGPSARPHVRTMAVGLVLLGVILMLGERGLIWGLTAAGGVLGGWRAPPLSETAGRRVGAVMGVLTLVGLGLTLDQGFVRVSLDLDRALMAEWGEDMSRVLPANSRSVFWTAGQPLRFRPTVDGPSFAALPPPGPGPALPERAPGAVDLAELGLASDCDALAAEALAGGTRARVQAVLRRCEVDLSGLAAADPALDAALVLRGRRAADPVSLMATAVDLPLDEPGAVMLAAKARLGAPRPAARALVDGGPYDRAVLLTHLSQADRQALVALLSDWSDEVPGPAGQDYRDALDAARLTTP
ncbi:MAG: hypothetical protein H6739_38780 [Alphaproteobacteria bacterium]|nr:hypothetical protein [Alphaproteobacteria bacterium]